ncbi:MULTISPECIES: aminopeptidase P family protein [unclassified Bifidobacterium]|uniref:aminopeptidase P family protein n=1 Tax=unclassified Bifidobacterium TaxID=2608897 RepID=UPI0023F73FD0|nr:MULTISPECIES: aminopeptidase P family protein [unclassified Bifidobacterium]WEV65254.1 Xaa-Pro aminopeptidase [Bifidobacterium sp. ESL0764]WEV75943.1 Xaa-Pro aminopeptidase [Bifidobacterium sp. ESL0800]
MSNYDSEQLAALKAAAADNSTEVAKRKLAGGLRCEGKGFEDIIFKDWDPDVSKVRYERSPLADDAAKHRDRLAGELPGERLVIPAGVPRHRTWDIDFLYHPGTAFTHLTGLGKDYESGAVLLIDPVVNADGSIGHDDTIYLEPFIDRTNPRFFSDSKHGEFWIGPRPLPEDFEIMSGIKVRTIDKLPEALKAGASPDGIRIRLLRGLDEALDAKVDAVRRECGLGDAKSNAGVDAVLEEREDEGRIIKTKLEIEEIRKAVRTAERGFDRVADMLPVARKVERGERLLESTFTQSARYEGNEVSFPTNAGSGQHATILDYHANNARLKDGDLFLIDAGVEMDSMYCSDITRTFPVNGKFTKPQREVYQAVLDSSNAAIAAANKPGAVYHDMIEAVMVSVAHSLERMGILPVSAEEALRPDGHQQYRWLYHGTGHFMGIDVHDSYHSRDEMYPYSPLKPGMVFTLEPGLYFDEADLLVPEQYRGIGVRIEDDLEVTEDGETKLMTKFARTPDEIEDWLAHHSPDDYLKSFLLPSLR